MKTNAMLREAISQVQSETTLSSGGAIPAAFILAITGGVLAALALGSASAIAIGACVGGFVGLLVGYE